jgi:hypothetical protein
VRFAPNDEGAIKISEIADSALPFSSVNTELQSQVRLWQHSDAAHRVSRASLCKFYLHRHELNISPETAEMCFISAGYARGYPMFWASRMDRTRLREVVDRELVHAKSPMSETLPFVVCAFMWPDRRILSDPGAKAVRKLKARNMVSNLLGYETTREFLDRAKRAGVTFDLNGTRYSIYELIGNSQRATIAFEELVQLEWQGKIDDKLRSFAHRLDLILHAKAVGE